MKRTLLTAALIVFMLPAAQADECKDPQDQATLNECASKSYKASDAKLNAMYRDIEHRLADDPDTKKLLVSA